jgi:C4-dicarboxylate-specific signal transduction histidine kinase
LAIFLFIGKPILRWGVLITTNLKMSCQKWRVNMNKYKVILGATVLAATAAFGVGGVLAQDSEATDAERRAAFEERREERRAEMETRREERWAEISEENPELAAEIEALRAEREAKREQARAEFAEKYPNIVEALEDGRINRAMLEGGRRGPQQGGPRGRR